MEVSLSQDVALAPTKYAKIIIKTIQMGGCLPPEVAPAGAKYVKIIIKTIQMVVSLSLEVALAGAKDVKIIVKTIQMGGCLCLDLHFDAYCTYPIYPACFAFAAYSVIFELCVHLLHILHFAHILHILHNPVWWGVVDLRTWAQGLCRAGPPPDFPNWPHINRTSTAHQWHINWPPRRARAGFSDFERSQAQVRIT